MSTGSGEGSNLPVSEPGTPAHRPDPGGAHLAQRDAAAPAVPRAALVQHGAAWVAAFAAVAGVVVTAVVGMGDGAARSGTSGAPTPLIVGTAVPTTAGPSDGVVVAATPVAATIGPFGPVLPSANEGADIVSSIVAPDLPPGTVHRMVTVGPAEGLSFDVPAAWRDGAIGGPWIYGNDKRTGVSAFFGPSEERFYRETLETNGVFVGASPDLREPVDELTQDAFELYWRECTIGGRGRWDDETYEGNYEIYGPCGDEPIRIIALLARDPVSGQTICINLHVTTESDLRVAAHLIDSVKFEPPAADGHGLIP